MSEQTSILDFLGTLIEAEVKENRGPSIRKLARYIKMYSKIDDILTIVVQGDSGSGKTTFALRLAATVYGRNLYKKGKKYFVHNWKKAFESIIWDPKTYFKLVYRLLRNGEKIPIVILDDAGTWLFKGPRNKVSVSFMKMYNLTRGLISSLVFTDIWSLDKYILDTAKIRIICQRLGKSEIRDMGLSTDVEWSRARVYYKKITIMGARYTRWGDIVFPLRTHDEWYKKYLEERRGRKLDLWKNSIKAFLDNGIIDKSEICLMLAKNDDPLLKDLCPEFIV